jgi:hypothetical protein
MISETEITRAITSHQFFQKAIYQSSSARQSTTSVPADKSPLDHCEPYKLREIDSTRVEVRTIRLFRQFNKGKRISE